MKRIWTVLVSLLLISLLLVFAGCLSAFNQPCESKEIERSLPYGSVSSGGGSPTHGYSTITFVTFRYSDVQYIMPIGIQSWPGNATGLTLDEFKGRYGGMITLKGYFNCSTGTANFSLDGMNAVPRYHVTPLLLRRICPDEEQDPLRCLDEINSYASESKDPSVCELLIQRSDVDSCFNAMSSEIPDVSLCERMTAGSFERDSCYGKVGSALGRVDYCNLSSRDVQREDCIFSIVRKTGDLQTCREQFNGTDEDTVYGRDYCYCLVAVETHNTTLCDEIQTEFRRDYCRDSFC